MTAPTLVDTWFTRAEVPFPSTTDLQATQRSWLWCLKAALTDDLTGGSTNGTRNVASKWTVMGSSDGSTAGMDAVDRWGTSFTAANLVRAAEGSAHSWIVLKSPTAMGPLYFLINYNGGSEGQASFTVSANAYTGGSTTAKPTSTGETALGNSSLTTAWAQLSNESTFNVTYKFGFACNDNGEVHVWINRISTGLFLGYLHLLKFRNQNASDTWKWCCSVQFLTTSRGAPSALSGLFSPSANCALRTPNSGARVASGGVSTYSFGGSAQDGSAPIDTLISKHLPLPLFAITYDSGVSAFRGTLQDVWAVGNPTVGGSYPSTGAQTQMVVGNLLVPSGVVCAL